MPIIARFNLAAEAAFFQTLLEEKGIPSTLMDNASGALGLNNVATTSIDVPDEYVAEATAIHAEYSKDNTVRADKTEQTHPNKRYPFLAVWTIASVIIAIVYSVILFNANINPNASIPSLVALVFIVGIFYGLLVTTAIAFVRVVIAMFKKKF